MVKMFLIRHGETDYTSAGRYCGSRNPSLNSKGRQQIKKLAIRLEKTQVDKVYSSNLNRAYESARIVFKKNLVEKNADFSEINFGIFEGLKYEELIEFYPKLYREWIDSPLKVKIPNGEKVKELGARVKKGLAFILSQNNNKTIALVTHGGPIKVMLCDILGLGWDKFWQQKADCAGLSIIEFSKGKVKANLINCIKHLNG